MRLVRREHPRDAAEGAAGTLVNAQAKVTVVDDFLVEVVTKSDEENSDLNLYFLNLGGYKPGDFEEYHYKVLTVSPYLATAVKI